MRIRSGISADRDRGTLAGPCAAGKSAFVFLVGVLVATGVAAGAAGGRPAPQASPGPSTSASAYQEVVERYCVACHNQRAKTAGLVLETLDFGRIGEHADVWEKVARKLGVRAMPPPGMPRPDAKTYAGFAAWLEAKLDAEAAAHPYAGPPRLQRLNRTEYANAIRDLFGLEVDVSSLLPPDNSAYGFDNVADALGVSPSLQERYLAAAATISALAVGSDEIGPTATTYRVPQDRSQNRHIEGLPLGTVGGTQVRHTFPLDGDYVFDIKLFRTNFGNVRGLEHPHVFQISVDGEQVHSASLGGDEDLVAAFEQPTATADVLDARLGVRVPIKAGTRSVSVDFIKGLPLLDTTRLQPFLRSSYDTLDWTGRPHIDSFTIVGPYDSTGPGNTVSRQRIFRCHPQTAAEEAPCAAAIVSALVRRAYRGPVDAADLQRVLDFYEANRRDGTFEAGIQAAVQLILASPRFVFRVERAPDDVVPGALYPLGDVELASRLSFFLWSSIPDEELLDLADQGKLSKPDVLEQQVRRMLADPRAEALVRNFAGQWLQLRNVRTLQPNSDDFPDFDDNLRQAFRRETELFFGSIIREDRSVLDLLNADYTFVNDRLARHYGIPHVYGSRFRRVAVTDDERKGLFGQGSFLAITSHATRTAPVLRGKWILENLLGTPPPPPPPDVPKLEENEAGQQPRTVRERMEAHRANPVCASCHKIMDPLGLALENFDAVGSWRTRDAGLPIDASGQLLDGTQVDGVVALREWVLDHADAFVGTMTEKLLTYALGRGLDYRDMPAVRAIVRRAARQDYRFSSLVLGVVHSVPFEMRMKPTSPAEAGKAAGAASTDSTSLGG